MNARTIFILTGMLLGAVATGYCWGQGRSKHDVRNAEAHVRSTFAAYGKAFSAQHDTITVDEQAKAAVQVVVRDTVLDYQYSAVPTAEITRRFGQPRIIISDGWVYMMREMLRATAVVALYLDNSDQGLSCMAAYKKTMIDLGKHNLKVSQTETGRLRVIPAFADFVRSGKAGDCAAIKADAVTSAKVEKHLLDGEDALLVWLLGWKWHLQHYAAMMHHPANETDAQCARGEQITRERAEMFSRNVLKKNLALAVAGIELHDALFSSTCPPTIEYAKHAPLKVCVKGLVSSSTPRTCFE